AEFLPERLDLTRQGRLRDAQAQRCLRDSPLLGHGNEGPQMPQIHSGQFMPIRHEVTEQLCIGPGHYRFACCWQHLRCACLAVWPASREEAMTLPRREFLQLAAAAAALPATSQIAKAQTYPARPVRVIVPYAPGGPVDIFARLAAQKLSEHLGKQFYVEDIAGAGGNI